MQKNLIKLHWNSNDTQIGCGSADRWVYVFDVGKLRIGQMQSAISSCSNS